MAVGPTISPPSTSSGGATSDSMQRKRISRTAEERRALRKQLIEDARGFSSSSSIDSTDSATSSSNFSASHRSSYSSQSSLYNANVGKIVPSDSAYIDQMLSSSSSTTPNEDTCFDMNEVYLYSDRKFAVENEAGDGDAAAAPSSPYASPEWDERKRSNRFQIVYVHTLQYKGETVWQLETTCDGDGIHGMFGETSTCSLSGSMLRIRIGTKQGGCDSGSRERFAKSIDSILSQSANEYHQICSSSQWKKKRKKRKVSMGIATTT